MFTDREHDILDEHFRDWFPDYGTAAFFADRDEIIDLLNDRIREEDEPGLRAELVAILDKYLGKD